MIIREATDRDAFKLVEMGMRFLAVSPYWPLLQGTTPERIYDYYTVVREHGCVLVAEAEGGLLVGLLAMVLVEHPLVGRCYADQVAWWVEPGYRSSTAALDLLKQMECWAMQRRAFMVHMPSPVGMGLGVIYARHGYRALETSWVKRLE